MMTALVGRLINKNAPIRPTRPHPPPPAPTGTGGLLRGAAGPSPPRYGRRHAAAARERQIHAVRLPLPVRPPGNAPNASRPRMSRHTNLVSAACAGCLGSSTTDIWWPWPRQACRRRRRHERRRRRSRGRRCQRGRWPRHVRSGTARSAAANSIYLLILWPLHQPCTYCLTTT